MTSEEYRAAGRFSVNDGSGVAYWILVFEHWFENESSGLGESRWERSGASRYCLADGRAIKCLSPHRFVVEESGEQLWRGYTGLPVPLTAG